MSRQQARSTGSGGFGRAFYTDDEMMYDDDMDYIPPARKKTPAFGSGGKERPVKRPTPAHSPPPGAGGQPTSPGKAVRSRPTNNQLLYKAYFRWAHYPHKLKNANLPVETDACASVTAAFLQVLQIMQTAEQLRHGSNKRNVLQILSSNTRRTKVVELSSGTHRVPDELKKHYLSDGEGGQYSTNLDRNRYGNDDNYLFTVIRYDLEFLGLCPCMVDVEIIDAKQGNSSIIVSAGTEVCTCQGGPPMGASGPLQMSAAVAPAPYHHPAAAPHHHGMPAAPPPARPAVSGERHAPIAVKAEYPPAASLHGHLHGQGPANGGYGAAGGSGGRGDQPDVGPLPQLYGPGGGGYRGGGGGGLGGAMGRESPKRSGTSVSQLFDALVMAATGGADGAAAAGGLGGEPPVTSPAHADRPDRGGGMGPGGGMGFGGMGGGGGGGGMAGARLHPPPNRNKSKLWSINNLSFGGEVDSLQNALDAFREQDEIASGDPAAFLTGGSAGGPALGPDGSLQRSDSLRQRRRKPLRNSSVLGRPASSGGVAPLGPKLAMNLREKSDDNLRLAAEPELGPGPGMGPGGGVQAGGMAPGNPHHHHHVVGGGGGGGGGVGTQVSSLVSGEDDNDGGAGEADAEEDALAAKEELGVEGEGEAGGEEEGQDEGAHRGFDGVGPTASGTAARAAGMAGQGPLRHHMRHVPRQSSVANLGPRVANSSGGGGGGANGGGAGGGGQLGGLPLLGPGGLGGSAAAAVAGEQLRRLANELEVMRQENRSLRQQLQRANSSTTLNGTSGGGGGGGVTGSPSLAGKPPLPQAAHDATEAARLRKLEAELAAMRNELLGISGAKKSADEENRQLKRELLASQQQVAALLTRVLGGGAAPGVTAAAAGLLAPPLATAAGPAQQQQQVAAAFDPSTFAPHFAALRQGGQQQLPQSGAAAGGGGGAEAAQAVASEVRPAAAAAAGVGGQRPQGIVSPARISDGAAADTQRPEPAPAAAAPAPVGPLGAAQPQAGGRKRNVEEAGLAALASAAGGEASQVQARPHKASPPSPTVEHDRQHQLQAAAPQPQRQLMSFPTFASYIPSGTGAQLQSQQQPPQQQSAAPQPPPQQAQQQQPLQVQQQQQPLQVQQQQQLPLPADSNTAATPADSTCFSDVVQLLALPNFDSGFTSAEVAVQAFGGGGGASAAHVSTAGVGGSGGPLAASSGLPTGGGGSGSGSGSGTASVPQLPQMAQYEQHMMLAGLYGAPQPHIGLR